MEKKIETCKKCGEDKHITARGLCGKCYTLAKARGEFEKFPTTRKHKEEKKPEPAEVKRPIAQPTEEEVNGLKDKMVGPSRIDSNQELEATKDVIIAVKGLDADARERVLDAACDILAILKR